MPIRLCSHPTCPEVAEYRGRCRHHTRQRERELPHRRGFYNSKAWRMLRKKRLELTPLCPCGMIATDVDHITPIKQDGPLLDLANTQALCRRCHGIKTRKERG